MLVRYGSCLFKTTTPDFRIVYAATKQRSVQRDSQTVRSTHSFGKAVQPGHVARKFLIELQTFGEIHKEGSYGAVSGITVQDQSRSVTRLREWTGVSQNAYPFLPIVNESNSLRENLHHSKMKSYQPVLIEGVWEGAEDNIWNFEGGSEGRVEEIV
jgi:hypothetical protein